MSKRKHTLPHLYNASILSALLLRNQEKGDEDPAALLRHISPVAWQHINFYGRFEFASIPGLIDIASIVQGIIRTMPPDTPGTLKPTFLAVYTRKAMLQWGSQTVGK